MSESPAGTARITVTDGPYKLEGGVPVTDATGAAHQRAKPVFLCRCGQSGRKPFCDGTHSKVGFVGTESADPAPMAERRDAYPGEGIVIYDDRARCAHAGVCTDTLASVWKLREEPWIDPHGAEADAIAAVVARCPSGALTYARTPDHAPIEEPAAAAVVAVPDGPYHVRGAIPVVAGDAAAAGAGNAYEPRERQTLCRCGRSANKPFCDGGHWHAGFRDPAGPA